jgi:hypothetical protein
MAKTLTGIGKVSNYQRLIINKVAEVGHRGLAAEDLGINKRTLDDALYRAFKALRAKSVYEAKELLDQGIRFRTEDEE